MLKTIKIIIIISFTLLFSFLIYKIALAYIHKKEVAENIKVIPKFTFYDLNDKPFSNENLAEGVSTIFIFFNTDCHFCVEESKLIFNNIEEFNNSQLIFVSDEDGESIMQFAKENNLFGLKNMIFLKDKELKFGLMFDVNIKPSSIIYDKDKKLVEKFKGQTTIKKMLKKLNDN
ncbi:redoxin domain-containing protein [Flavobacterium jejuense]|uniref:Redoxin domain-containing protein n=1 Tax=Flavobacterium jejuense TaxID=1544455 RepID=A0ABX0IU92_9FLAO|nr:redoxin family protein [Flavobacterium jejuense]NHN27377.1 redoxin domain-containing protein [Flavobacterium jejuense]